MPDRTETVAGREPDVPTQLLCELHEHGLVVAPHVVAHLGRELGGERAAVVQTARLLTPDQLRGASMLPDPLPVTHVVAASLADLDDDQRRALLVAAVAVVDRTQTLLDATGLETTALLATPLTQHLVLTGGRFAFADPRTRAVVHADAGPADRAAAHRVLADAHARAGEADEEVWHAALAEVGDGADLVPRLLRVARRHLERGDVVRAHEVAREAASRADIAQRGEACAVAGEAALCGGHVQDAADWLREAARSGDDLHAATLSPLVLALTLTQGQVPDDVLAPHVHPGTGEPVPPGVVHALATAARLHAERGDGAAAALLLAAGERLGGVGRPGGADPDGSGLAATELARRWAAVFGVGGATCAASPTDDDAWSPGGDGDRPDHRAYAQLCRALACAAADDLDGAAQTVASTVAELGPVRDRGPWFDGPATALTPLAEAHVRVVQALVDVWRGDLPRAAATLADAAWRLPLGLPFAGLAVAVARRLDMLTAGEVGDLATALEETCASPVSRPVRLGLLVDRALAAGFARHVTQAATLLELAAERERPDDARLLPLPGLDDVEAWVAAGRPEEARRAGERRRADAEALPASLRAVTTTRAQLVLASPEQLDAALEHAAAVGRETVSLYERARTDLCAARVLVRVGDSGRAYASYVSAIELFTESGALAWARVARAELGALATTDGPVGPDGADLARSADQARAARSRWSDVLTAREGEVALLVVQGRSNREVADELFLSVRTVEVHLGRVFRKLDVRSRVELTVLAHGGRSGVAADPLLSGTGNRVRRE